MSISPTPLAAAGCIDHMTHEVKRSTEAQSENRVSELESIPPTPAFSMGLRRHVRTPDHCLSGILGAQSKTRHSSCGPLGAVIILFDPACTCDTSSTRGGKGKPIRA